MKTPTPPLPNPGAEPAEYTRFSRWILITLAISMLLSSLGVSIANVALPTLSRVFDVPFNHVQWVVLSYLLAITVLSVSAGRLGDYLGHRRVLLFGVGLFTVASVACGLAPSLWVLVAARAFQGLGAAILLSLTIALVGEAVPKAKTGGAMGLLGTMSAIGTALGPSLGGVLIAGSGWRALFLAMVPVGAVLFLLALRFLPKPDSAELRGAKEFDILGTMLLTVTLGSYALAVTAGAGHAGQVNPLLLGFAAVGAVLFLYFQTRAKTPLIRLSAFRNLTLSAGLALNVVVASVMMATLVIGPFYLSRALGLTEALVGLVLSAGPIMSTVSGVPAGRLVDRFGAGPMMTTALFVMTAGCAGLAAASASLGVAGYVAAIAVLTPGYQLFQAANNTAVMKGVERTNRGVFSGLLSLSRNLGLITGASVMGAVFTFAAGTGDPAGAAPEAIAFGMTATFALAAGVVGLAAAVAVALRFSAPGDGLVQDPS